MPPGEINIEESSKKIINIFTFDANNLTVENKRKTRREFPFNMEIYIVLVKGTGGATQKLFAIVYDRKT